MRGSFKYSLIFALAFFSFLLSEQERKALEKERDRIAGEISYTNRLIDESKKGQRLTQTQLVLLNKQIELRQDLIRETGYEVDRINNSIEENSSVIEALEEDLQRLREEYARMIQFAYMNRNSYDRLTYIFASNSFAQAYKRSKYLQQFTTHRKQQAELITETQVSIQAKIETLEAQKEELGAVLGERKAEKSALDKDKGTQQDALRGFRNEEKQLRKEVKRKEKEKARLTAAIKKAIEDEIRRTRNDNDGHFSLTPEAQVLSDEFASNKGKLPWPVERGVITGSFGRRSHPTVPGIMVENDGIDISTTKGATVRCVFEGEVSAVIVLPGAGKAVIVSHGAYRTVYSNLKEVFVAKGEKLSTKQDIGIALNDDAGTASQSHFEIWQITANGMKKQDPGRWVYRQ